jgi:putative lipoprotein
MKRLMITFLFLCAPSFAAEKDSFKGDDKALHLGVSFALGVAAGSQWPDNKLKAFGVAMIPGVLKEISDRSTTGFSGKDLVADAVGAALGVYTAHWLITRQNGKAVVAYTTTF